MIGGHRVVAIVPARGGSKSVPLKNLREVGGKPLLAWAVDAARATPEIDRVVVSTDHEGIAATARACGAEVLARPAELASDTAIMADVLRHHIAELRAAGETVRYLVLVEPTAPFRLASDVSDCLRLLDGRGLDSVATFTEAGLNPHRAWVIEADAPRVFVPGAVPWLPRQRLPKAYQLNGAVYAFVADRLPADAVGLLFGRTGAVVMDRHRSLDIDDSYDLVVADALLRSGLLAHA